MLVQDVKKHNDLGVFSGRRYVVKLNLDVCPTFHHPFAITLSIYSLFNLFGLVFLFSDFDHKFIL